ncbi:hypothetical protein [Micromonospora sp. NPDC051141]|uniref:hypothetical protein n=1 Tax=Micromonospora sp. NPDC051141 TaxID=3364284 RepID=UPI00378EF47C
MTHIEWGRQMRGTTPRVRLGAMLVLLMLAGSAVPAAAVPPDGSRAGGTRSERVVPAPPAAVSAGTHAAANRATLAASWATGQVAPGDTQGWVWNNANPLTVAYQVGFSPTGASAALPCQFEVTRRWYSQQPGGERRFHFQIRNNGAITCAATVLLSAQPATYDWTIAPLAPGATGNYRWVEQVAPTVSYLLGLSPTGASGAAACQLEITRTWYLQEAGAVRKFAFVVRNIGAVTCGAQVRLAQLSVPTTWYVGTLAPAGSSTWTWNNANPLTAVHLIGLSPWGAQLTDPCQMEITRSWYVQRVNPDGTTQRQLALTVTNVGAISCTATVFLTPLTT